MNDAQRNLLTYGLIFAVVLLFNYVRERIARRQQRHLPRQENPQPRDPEVAETFPRGTAEALSVSSDPEAFVRGSKMPAVLGDTAPRARAFLVGRRNLRQAIVIMTVLGPCRAQLPPGVDR